MTTPQNALLVARTALGAGNAMLTDVIVAELGVVAGMTADEMVEHAAIAWELREKSLPS